MNFDIFFNYTKDIKIPLCFWIENKNSIKVKLIANK
jgi:hypothetical protein